MCKLILLGGVPGVGKTTIAYELARTYKIDKVLSIDVIKNVIKKFISNKQEPYLYTTTHEAYTLENLNIVDGYKKHSQILNKYVIDILDTFKNEKIIILEGATLTKEIIKDLKDFQVYYFNLYLENESNLIERYESKLKIRKGRWIENIDKIKEINKYLLNQNCINIKAENIKETLKEIRRYIDEDLCN
ncbi:MAG: AAA family ATPase [Bacilli bacterium]|nr:AAA family ATPase [Bacilli bacterium]